MYSLELAQFIFKSSKESLCRLKDGIVLNSNHKENNCYYSVKKKLEKISKQFTCNLRKHNHFVCQIIKIVRNTTTLTNQVETVETENKSRMTVINSKEKGNYLLFYKIIPILCAIVLCTILSVIAILVYMVSIAKL